MRDSLTYERMAKALAEFTPRYFTNTEIDTLLDAAEADKARTEKIYLDVDQTELQELLAAVRKTKRGWAENEPAYFARLNTLKELGRKLEKILNDEHANV